MKIVSIVGARPQFVKAGVVSRAIRSRHDEVLVHTGQHFDDDMSAVFFRDLGLPEPDHHLGVGSGNHGEQTGTMIIRIERTLLDEEPEWVLVYGDTNSTLAGALAAAKLHVRVAHVEAGLRSFNRRMPEETNRVLTDHVSSLLLCPSRTAVDNLAAEGITAGVRLVGDVMADALNLAAERANASRILDVHDLQSGGFLLATVHRAENTDDPATLGRILSALGSLEETVVLPAHPRTRKAMAAANLEASGSLRLIDPVGYLDMVRLEQNARMILTDSGGMQKEAYWLGIPCVTLREETEWVETVEHSWNVLAGSDEAKIHDAVRSFSPPAERPPLYGDGNAASKCVEALEE
jgi:UDP-N-acetylglucosamine 2-epimerase